MNRRVAVIAAAAVIVAAIAAAMKPPLKAAAPFSGEPEVIAATFSSAWCAPCRILKPRLARVMPEFEGAPVKFVEYDFTFGASEDLKREAAADRLGPLFQTYSKATGYTLLVDADTGELISMLTAEDSTRRMRNSIENAIAVAQAAKL